MKYLIHFVNRDTGEAGTLEFATREERVNTRHFTECHKFSVIRFEEIPESGDFDPEIEKPIDIGPVLDAINDRQKPLFEG